MADISSFLSDGQIPAQMAYKSLTSQTVLPDWYTNYAMQLLSNQQQQMTTPYQAYQGPRVAEFAPMQQQGFEATPTAANAYQPALGQATTATQGAMAAPGGLATAQPYLAQAGQTSVANIGQYMNPYTEQVVNRIADVGARNLSEKLIPGITSKYITAGQLGYGPRAGAGTPSGMMTDTARALRDTQEAVLAEQSKALQAGYGQAAELASTDLARQAGLATTAGGLAGTDITRQLAGAQQLAGMGETAQTLGLRGAGALQQVGATQQAQAQKNLDVAYGDFLRQQGYNQDQINKAVATFGGVAAGVPKATVEEGIVPTGNTATYGPSTADTIAGTAAAAGGVYDLLKKFGVF